MSSDEPLYTCPDSINPHLDCDHPQRTTGDILRQPLRPTIEFNCTGDGTFVDCLLKINGEPVYNCMGLTIDVQPGGWVETTLRFEGGPVRFSGTLFEPQEPEGVPEGVSAVDKGAGTE